MNDQGQKPWKPEKAYRNVEFLSGHDGRTIRVLCEFIEPQARFRRLRVKNTVVMFGSARVRPQDEAETEVAEISAAIRAVDPPDPELEVKLKIAKDGVNMARYYTDARRLSEKLTRWSMTIKKPSNRFYICSGGGPGIMEAANRGAHDAGGPSIGLNISLPHEQYPNTYQTRRLSFEFHYFFIRKFWFFYLAKALVVFPGGFGTMDEFFELLTLIQTQKTKKFMPIVVYGSEFWTEIINFDALVRHGMISPEDLSLFRFSDDVDDAFEYLRDQLTKHYIDKSKSERVAVELTNPTEEASF